MRLNNDGLGVIQNMSKGMNTPYDTTSQIVTNASFYNWGFLTQLYRESWQCRKVVDFFPDKMIKKWGEIVFAEEHEQVEELEGKLSALKRIYNQGQKVGNLYGDGYVVRLVDDGNAINEPINWEDVKTINYSRVFDNQDISPDVGAEYGSDYYNPDFYYFSGKIEDTQVDYHIHKDRVIRFSGNFLPPLAFEQNNYCHASVLEPFLVPYTRLDQALHHIAEAVTSFELILFGVKGLIDDLSCGTPEQQAAIQRRYKIAQQQLSSMRGGVHDLDDESVQIVERKFTNIDRVVKDVFREEAIAASGLNKTQLYNQHPTGLNATGQSELRTQAERILEFQELKWSEQINFDLKLIMAQHDIFEGFSWQWLNTYQPTTEEEIKNRKTIADTDKIYVEMGAIMPEEARSRFEQSEYQQELTLEDKAPEERQPQQKTDAVEKFRTEGNLLFNSDFAPIELEDLRNVEED